MSAQYEKFIPIPLLIATAIVGYMIFTGGVPILGIGGEEDESLSISAVGDISPLLPNAPRFKCPNWMDAETCTTLSNSCGNGVCDAHELCNTCQFDCGCGGAQVCNAQTGRCHSPAGVCQAPRGAG
ncbi:MAG TPA: hypothetical protein EYM50_01615 [Nitrososphaerales archaeon]|jgi:hypothetical protein|nr:MAG: hypothetical protein CXX68_01410 [Nitrososphaerota archaeon]HIM82433.1 hypothetical protein [Nitrososphaerales archaeon]